MKTLSYPLFLSILVACLLGASALTGCSSDDGDGAAGASAGTTAGAMAGTGSVTPAGDPTFAAIFSEILTLGSAGNCTFGGCHGAAPGAANGNLQLFPSDRNATYAALVNVVSTGICTGQTYVVPGQPEMSMLYQKLAGTQTCGGQMPVVPLGTLLTPEQLEQVRLWIANGAMNDGEALPTAGTTGGMMAGEGGTTAGVVAGEGGTMAGEGGTTAGVMAGEGGMMAGEGGTIAGEGGMNGGGEFTLTSSAFTDGGMLPSMHRCVSLFGGGGPSPALMWSNPPEGTMSFALTMTDMSNNFAHWTIFNIPAATTELPGALMTGAMPAMPAGAVQSPNSAPLAGPGYFGPCGQTNNPYVFTLYAINVAQLPAVTSASARAAVQAAIDANDIASVSITAMSGP